MVALTVGVVREPPLPLTLTAVPRANHLKLHTGLRLGIIVPSAGMAAFQESRFPGSFEPVGWIGRVDWQMFGHTRNRTKEEQGYSETQAAARPTAIALDAHTRVRSQAVNDGPVKRVQAGNAWIEYRVRRSRRRKKTYQISIKSGQALVEVPYSTTNRQAEEMVLQKARWILSKLAIETLETPAPSLLSGEELPYGGRKVTLSVEGVVATIGGGPEVSLDRQKLRILVPVGLEEEDRRNQVGQALFAWYGERATEQIWGHLGRWWPILGRGEGPTVRIRNQRRRWGSCSSDGVLRFNWRLAMLDPSLTEYVVVHELAHLTHMNHSPDFWGLVEEHLPDVKERRRMLREAGAGLPDL